MSIAGRAALAAALLSVLAGCSRSASEGVAPARPAVPITVATATQRDVPVELRTIGTVEPYSTVILRAQIEGQLAMVHFKEGQRVEKGALLFTIDPRPFEAALRQAEANLARDLAASKNAAVDAQRRTQLLRDGFVSRDEYDQAQTRAASSAATVQANRAAVETAKLWLQYCYVRSPLDGRIGRILVHDGNVVKANDTELAVVNQIRPVYVTFSVPEKDLPEIRQRAARHELKVAAGVGGDGAVPALGDLSFINNTVDANTGTVLLKGEFANADEHLWPGQFVDVTLTLSIQAGAVVVPAHAVQTGQQGQFVFVVTADNTAQLRPVVMGETLGSEVVVRQGLTEGERVVTDGQLRLTDGAKVEIKAAPDSSGGQAQAEQR